MYSNELPDMSAAYKQVQEKSNNDGNLANNAVPYDKVTKADIITGAKGKDEQGGKKKPKGHDCAKQVKYEGKEYDVIPEAHTLLEDGTVTHYDIEDAEYVYENVPVEDLEILISEKHEHFANYDKNAEVLGEADSLAAMAARREKRLVAQRKKMGTSSTGQDFGHDYGISSAERKKRQKAEFDKFVGKKEAFAFSEADFAELETLGEEIDSLTDEQLIDVMEEIILEMAQDDQDLIEICEHLEGVEVLSEEKTKQLELKLQPSRMDRLKSAAKKAGAKVGAAAKAAGSAAKKGIKAAGKSAVDNAGKAVGTFQGSREAARIKAKRASMQKTPAKSSSSDNDGTGGKLDGVLDSIRKSKGTSSSSSSSSDSGSSSSGGGESSSSSSSAPAKKGPGLLRRAAGAIGRGLKKAVGKTARAVSSGSGKLAKRLGEDYEQIAHLYESGLFSIEEIENVIEEGYKELPKNKMFRKAGNLGREVVSPSTTDAKRQKSYDRSKKIVKVMNKETEKQERGEK
ncbi:gp185 [Synechococcus phage S-CAM8]|uniref:Gp185 n=1 Tax=Synechococcus phage S-CAM8 TaxID=754038 RepID=G8EY71_9CAUD|nr:gp185 [Synechococcus phage S-CAM8]